MIRPLGTNKYFQRTTDLQGKCLSPPLNLSFSRKVGEERETSSSLNNKVTCLFLSAFNGRWLVATYIYLWGRIIFASPETGGCPRYPRCPADGFRSGFDTISGESLLSLACTSPRICRPETSPRGTSSQHAPTWSRRRREEGIDLWANSGKALHLCEKGASGMI